MGKFLKSGIVVSGTVAGASLLIGGTAVSSGQSGALVRLQSTSPGVQQSGNVNISGTILGNRMELGGLVDSNFAMTGQAPGGLWIKSNPYNAIHAEATTPSGNYPAIVATVGAGSSSLNSAVWARQTVSGSQAYLASGQIGVLAYAPSADTGFAGWFNGRVISTGALAVGTSHDPSFMISTSGQGGILAAATQYNGLVARTSATAAAYPAIVGIVESGSLASNIGVWGWNQVTNSSAYLARGEDGVVASTGNAGTGYAGRFNGRVYVSGTLGIGVLNPVYPLSFPDSLGDKISLWGQGANHYGFGVQSGLLQIHGDTSAADVAFGHGSSGAFTETMRIKGTGNVGIGVNAPTSKLHIRGGNLYVENGFGGTPTINLAVGDTDTGLHSLGDGQLDVFSNSASAMSFRGFNVGIGTVAPSSRLHLLGATSTPLLYANNTTTTSYAIHALLGSTAPSYPFADRSAVRGDATGGAVRDGVIAVSDTGLGVFGYSALGGYGVFGRSDHLSGRAVFGYHSAGGTAGYFTGSVAVTGSLSKGSGTFKIDHPLDPEGKYLYHSFVESPDMMNIYNGEVRTDERGFATVTLPSYFEALNRDFRYQLTIVDDGDTTDFVLAKVVQRIKGNTFVIKTSQPNIAVCWEVTGVRQDAFANAHRVRPEVDKEPENQGLYLHPKEHGLPEERGIDYQDLKRRGINQPATKSK